MKTPVEKGIENMIYKSMTNYCKHMKFNSEQTKEMIYQYKIFWKGIIIESLKITEKAVKKKYEKEIAINRSEVYDEMNKELKKYEKKIKELKDDIDLLNFHLEDASILVTIMDDEIQNLRLYDDCLEGYVEAYKELLNKYNEGGGFQRMEEKTMHESGITLCVGWDTCQCNRCKLARLWDKNQEDRKFIFNIYKKLKEVSLLSSHD